MKAPAFFLPGVCYSRRGLGYSRAGQVFPQGQNVPETCLATDSTANSYRNRISYEPGTDPDLALSRSPLIADRAKSAPATVAAAA